MNEDKSISQIKSDKHGVFIKIQLNGDEYIDVRLCKKCGKAPLFKEPQTNELKTEIYCSCGTSFEGSDERSIKNAIQNAISKWNEYQLA